MTSWNRTLPSLLLIGLVVSGCQAMEPAEEPADPVGETPVTSEEAIEADGSAESIDVFELLIPGSASARDCLGAALLGDASLGIEAEEAIRSGEGNLEDIYEAWSICVGIPVVFSDAGFASVTDLGFVIDYSTPGIIALPMDDPGFMRRPRGIETLADPSAILLADNRVALYFAGDHSAPGRSTRWVSSEPVSSAPESLTFSPEADYTLATMTSWRNIIPTTEGFVAFGQENMREGLSRWESADGLEFENKTVLISPQQWRASEEAEGRVVSFEVSSQNITPNSAVTSTDSFGFFAVFEGLREGFGVEECPPECDRDGDGYESGESVTIYRSEDGISWSPSTRVGGASEGSVVEVAPGVLALVLPTGVTHFSTDGDTWGFGVSTGISHLDLMVEDGSWLGFGTQSASDGGIPAWSVNLDVSALDPRWLEPASFDAFASLAAG